MECMGSEGFMTGDNVLPVTIGEGSGMRMKRVQVMMSEASGEVDGDAAWSN